MTDLMSTLTRAALLLAFASAGCGEPRSPERSGLLDPLVDDHGELRAPLATTTELVAVRSSATGSPSLVRAARGHLAIDDAMQPARERARSFLAGYGAVIGLDATARNAVPVNDRAITTDAAGRTQVRLAQTYQGLPVFGGELVVHLDDEGVTAVAGVWVPIGSIAIAPAVAEAHARTVA